MNQTDVESTKAPVVDIEKIKALANKDRLKILGILLEKGPMSWTQLQEEVQMNPNSLNFHLTKLLHSEFIAREIVESESGRPGTRYQILPQGKVQYKAIK